MPNLIRSVNFGTNRTGLSTVAYTLINTDGTTKQARTTSGVFEVAVGSGIYACLITFTAAWEGIVLWDDGQATKRYALDVQWKSQITDEIADAVFDEDITGHTTANSAGARLNAIFQYVRGGTGGGVVTRQAGALTDEDKDKIFKWFDLLVQRTKTLQESTDNVLSQLRILYKEHTDKLTEVQAAIPSQRSILKYILPKIHESKILTLSEFIKISNKLDQKSNSIEKEIVRTVSNSITGLRTFSETMFEEVKVKEKKWEDLKELIKAQNNTEEILRTLHLFFKDSETLKIKLEDIFKESLMCSNILSRLPFKLKDMGFDIDTKDINQVQKQEKTLVFVNISQLKSQIKDHVNAKRRVVLVTFQGQRIEVPAVEIGFVHQSPGGPPDINLKREEESDPAMFKQNGIIIVPPHARWIWEGRKKLIVKSKEFTEHIDEPLYLLSGSLCYGVIKLKKPRKISISEFNNLKDKHMISTTERIKWWPFKKEFWAYDFELTRKWTKPKKWQVQRGPQIFVNNVKFEENLFQEKGSDEPTREESVKREMAQFGDWYLVRQPKGKKFRYVVQHHVRGESVHVDLRMEANGHLVGITNNTPEIEEGSKQTQKDVQFTKANKFLYPRSPSLGKDFQILTELKLVQPKVWLKVQGKIPAGGIGATRYKEAEFKIVSTGMVKFGTQKSDFHEYFLEPDGKHEWDKNIKGRWIHALIPRPQHYKKAGEGKLMWGMFKSNKDTPYVEYHNFETEKKKAIKDKIDMIWQNPNGTDLRIVAGKGNLPKELKQYAAKNP